MELIGSIISLFGSIFLFLGALGIVRMPDIYNRMQSGTKATTLGSILFMVGIAIGFAHCTCLPKIIILILFIIFTNPISSHALARAAHHFGIPLTKTSVQDDLQTDQQGDDK
jgi:multicomponent Na+:H+ antiporter subunit G